MVRCDVAGKRDTRVKLGEGIGELRYGSGRGKGIKEGS